MGSPEGPSAPAFRITDLHSPDILPILGIPTIAPPALSSLDNDAGAADAEKPAAVTLDAVIKMLGEANVSALRPLETPKQRPDETTPLMAAFTSKAPTIFTLQKNAGAEKRRNVNKRVAEAPPPISPAPAAPNGTPGTGLTPNTESAERTKRARTSLKLSIAAAEKATLAPTVAEEATTTAKALVSALEAFCHDGEDGDGSVTDNEATDDEATQTEPSRLELEGIPKGTSPAHMLLADIRHVVNATVKASGVAATMQQVPREVLSRTLRALRTAADRGRHTLLQEGDEEGNPQVVTVLGAMEAAVAALRLSVAALGSSEHVVSEEVLEAAVEVTRFQLQHNILPFHDARLRAATRPELGSTSNHNAGAGEDENENGGDNDGAGPSKPSAAAKAKGKGRAKGGGGAGAKGRGKGQSQLGLQIPSALAGVTDRVQAVISLLCDLLPAIKVPTSMIIPLLRSAVASITVPDLPALHTKAAALLAAAFCSHLDLRRTILDDMFAHAAPYLGHSAKSLKRDFALVDAPVGGATSIQIFTAAVLQMVQGCAQLPSADASAKEVVAAFGPAVKAADYFWTQCLDRLQTARTQKAETDQDFTALLQGIVTDLLAAAGLPEWPAATTLLLRLATTINSQRGLQHTDPVVRQACVDLLGRLLATVHAGEAAVREEQEWLDGMAEDNGYSDATHAAQELLLKYLSDRQHNASAAAALARRFWLVRGLSEGAAAVVGAQVDGDGEESAEHAEQVQASLVETRKKAEELDVMVYHTGIDAADACKLMRQAVHAAFSRASPAMLSWLLEMLDPRLQGPTTRAKAVKALADLAAADPAVLGMPGVQAAVERSLGDESISVREASLALLGRHMVGDPELALSLINTVIKAVDDPGSSVRKCAIRILKDAAIAVPGFPRATDACCALLPRATDSEESVQNAVSKVFHALWFSPQVESTDPKGGTVHRTLAERAAQLADVAEAAYEAGGTAIHLPMDSQTPLVGVLRAALGWDAKGDLRVEWKAGREVAEALLESILAEQLHQPKSDNNDSEEGGADEDAIRPALLALHALAVTDADFCVPENDPQKFLRALAPHLKAAPDTQYNSEVDRRNAAERMLCVLSVVECVLSQVERLSDTLGALADVPGDLVNLINQHRYTQVVAAACKCLSVLAQRSSAAATRLLQVAQVYYSWLQSPGQHSPGNFPRFLYILGQLCRYGAEVLDKAGAAAPASPSRVTLPACLALFGKYWKFNGVPALRDQVQRCALEAAGQIAIARPVTMVESSETRNMLETALHGDATPGFKMAALSTLTEMLQADAESLERRQKVQQTGTTPAAAKKRGRGGTANGGSTGKKKARKTKNGGVPAETITDDEDDEVPRGTAVATENGEGDNLSQSSAVLQQHWEAVLVLATDSGAGGRAVADGVAIRRRVVALIEVVLRDGLVGPWTAVPALVGLASDTFPEVSRNALRLLCELAEKHPMYVDAGRLTLGLEQAFKLHCGTEQPQQQGQGKRRANATVPAAALSALGAMYTRLIWPSRPRRIEFLRALLRQFRAAVGSRAAQGKGGGPPLRLLAFIASVAGALPFKRAEEACILIQEASGICASHTDAVLVELSAVLGEVDGDEDDAAPAVQARAGSARALAGACRAAAALCMLQRLRSRVERGYSISAERAAAFAAAGKRKTAEETNAVVLDASVGPLQVVDLDLGPEVDAAKARQLYEELETAHVGGDMA